MTWRPDQPVDEPFRVRLTMKSLNRKTGPIPVTASSPSTCPPSCAWYGKGCYAESHYIGARWRKVPSTGMAWSEFLDAVMEFPPDQLWRHNEAGDLPGHGEDLDCDAFYDLVRANDGRQGFTYTHKDPIRYREAFEWANREGFAVNLSCDSIGMVDTYREMGLEIPLTVVVGEHERRRNFKTPGGAFIVVCPAQTTDDVSCATCRLCSATTRKTVIGFKAHGSSKRSVSERSATRDVQISLPIFNG